MIDLFLVHVVKMYDEGAVAHKHAENLLVLRIERLGVGFVCQLYHSCTNKKDNINNCARSYHLALTTQS